MRKYEQPVAWSVDNLAMRQNRAGEEPVNTLGGGVPADQGLSGLGLLMQFSGGWMAMAAVIAAVTALSGLTSRAIGSGELFMIAALSGARSLLHYSAGTALLYRTSKLFFTPVIGIRRYIAAAWIHSFLIAVVMQACLGVSTSTAIGVGIGLALWPSVLAVMVLLPGCRWSRIEISIAEDRGFEGMAIYNALFGIAGASIVSAAMAFVMAEMYDGRLEALGGLELLAMAALVVRSVLQVCSGLFGLRATSTDRAITALRRYFTFAVIGAASCMLPMLFLSVAALWFSGVLIAAGCACLLLVWPWAMRRFIAERQLWEFVSQKECVGWKRSPDGGLTWLGWLLIGLASVTASVFVIQGFAVGRIGYGDAELAGPDGLTMNWVRWAVPFVVLQAWAGFELVRMSQRARAVSTAFGIAASCSALYLWGSLIELTSAYYHGLGIAVSVAVLGFALAVPVGTCLLVRRKLPVSPPTATARFRAEEVGE